MNISGNTILVTGATSGIGRALAEALHDPGNQVIVAGRRQAELEAVTASRPGIAGFQLDLRDRARRTAERDGTYDELYARINPA